jgi:serine/threonine-protein kinase HipA
VRELRVYVDKEWIGTLSEENDLWVFEYSDDWTRRDGAFDLSPALPRSRLRHADGGSDRPVQWYFDNLLPEEDLRIAVAKDAGIPDHQDAFALLTYLGAESAGSLTLLPPGEGPATQASLVTLPTSELSSRIRKLPHMTLARSAPKRMSVAGAQNKLLVVMKGNDLYEPVGATASTHILKPDHPDANAYPVSAFLEHLTMRLARAAGLNVPDVTLLRVPDAAYVIARFDRDAPAQQMLTGTGTVAPLVRRLHAIDACQLLNKSRLFKHSGASLEALQGVTQRVGDRVSTPLLLFRWLVFNILVGNDDCHLKNLSFLVRDTGISLAPHYDLLATGAYHTKALADDDGNWPHIPMVFALPGASTFAKVTEDSVLAAGLQLGVPKPAARRIIKNIVDKTLLAFQAISTAHEAQTEQVSSDPSAASRHRIESHLLRVLKHIVLLDMSKRLMSTSPVVDHSPMELRTSQTSR